MINGNKTIHGVVDDLPKSWHGCCVFVKGPEQAGGKSTIAEFNKLFLKDAADRFRGQFLILGKITSNK